jgi:hypothetical protein
MGLSRSLLLSMRDFRLLSALYSDLFALPWSRTGSAVGFTETMTLTYTVITVAASRLRVRTRL